MRSNGKEDFIQDCCRRCQDLSSWARESRLNSKHSKGKWGLTAEGEGAGGGKSLRGHGKGGGLLLTWPHRKLVEGKPKTWMSTCRKHRKWGMRNLVSYQRWEGFSLKWLSRILAETGLGRPQTGWGGEGRTPRSRPSWEEDPEEPDGSLVREALSSSVTLIPSDSNLSGVYAVSICPAWLLSRWFGYIRNLGMLQTGSTFHLWLHIQQLDRGHWHYWVDIIGTNFLPNWLALGSGNSRPWGFGMQFCRWFGTQTPPGGPFPGQKSFFQAKILMQL